MATPAAGSSELRRHAAVRQVARAPLGEPAALLAHDHAAHVGAGRRRPWRRTARRRRRSPTFLPRRLPFHVNDRVLFVRRAIALASTIRRRFDFCVTSTVTAPAPAARVNATRRPAARPARDVDLREAAARSQPATGTDGCGASARAARERQVDDLAPRHVHLPRLEHVARAVLAGQRPRRLVGLRLRRRVDGPAERLARRDDQRRVARLGIGPLRVQDAVVVRLGARPVAQPCA